MLPFLTFDPKCGETNLHSCEVTPSTQPPLQLCDACCNEASLSRANILLHLAVTVDGKASKLHASLLIFSSVHPDADLNMREYHKLHIICLYIVTDRDEKSDRLQLKPCSFSSLQFSG